jgi:hypothetical protein
MPKKGPELKLPDLKVPDFMLDIYYDLRERHLLPLVAILLVALVALPIALTRGGSEPEAAESGAVATASSLPSSSLVVAKAAPGLRDYRRRLGDRTPQDPFVQRYAGEKSGATAVGSVGSGSTGSTSSSSTESSSVTVESTSTESTEVELPAEGTEEPSANGKLTFYSYVIDVRITPGSGFGPNKPEPSVRRDQPELTMLPSRKVPALTFMTVSKDEKKVLMLVNDNVRGLFGDGVCVVGTDSCQLLALEPGIPETVVYGADERTYRIEVLKLHFVTTDSLDKAPLGKQKQG